MDLILNLENIRIWLTGKENRSSKCIYSDQILIVVVISFENSSVLLLWNKDFKENDIN